MNYYAMGQADALAALGLSKQADLRQTVLSAGQRMVGGMRGMFTPTQGMQAFTQGAEHALAATPAASAATQTFRQMGHAPMGGAAVPHFAAPSAAVSSAPAGNLVSNAKVTFQGDLGKWRNVPLEQGKALVPQDVINMGVRKATVAAPAAPVAGGGIDLRSWASEL